MLESDAQEQGISSNYIATLRFRFEKSTGIHGTEMTRTFPSQSRQPKLGDPLVGELSIVGAAWLCGSLANYMTRRCKLLRVHFWSSCAVGFGAGHLVLSSVNYGVLVAIAITLVGAIAKLVVSDKLERETEDTSDETSCH